MSQQDQLKLKRPVIRMLSELVEQMLDSEGKADFKTRCLINMGKPMLPRLLQKLDDDPALLDKIKIQIRQALDEDDTWLKSKNSGA
jgi:hypothetical protein